MLWKSLSDLRKKLILAAKNWPNLKILITLEIVFFFAETWWIRSLPELSLSLNFEIRGSIEITNLIKICFFYLLTILITVINNQHLWKEVMFIRKKLQWNKKCNNLKIVLRSLIEDCSLPEGVIFINTFTVVGFAHNFLLIWQKVLYSFEIIIFDYKTLVSWSIIFILIIGLI